MIKKLKYKIWKSLTKKLITNKQCADNIFKLKYLSDRTEAEGKWKKHLQSALLPETSNNSAPNLIVAVQGILFSGSGALICYFQEFDNTRVFGSEDTKWMKNSLKLELASECRFFRDSHFMNFLHAFEHGTPEEKDGNIKDFIEDLIRIYKHKMTSFDWVPELYGKQFFDISRKLLFSVLDMDEKTKEYMSDKIFPYHVWDEGGPWDDCSFCYTSEKHKYLFYRFKDMGKDEFSAAVTEFLQGFFSIIGGKEFIVYDQLLQGHKTDINQYLKKPIRLICVTRDPRDRFTTCMTYSMPTPKDLDEYCEEYLKRIANFSAYPNCLMIRFEDLVLKYEETTARVREFIGLDENHHTMPKALFDPAISVVNVGIYKQYHNQDFMREIETKLSEYCFYPDRENLSNEALTLLQSSGNWNNI